MGRVPIPTRVWVATQHILADPSGRAARIWFGRMRNRIAVGAIRQAALVPDGAGGSRYTWADQRARRIAALGIALLMMGCRLKGRYGRWGAQVRGLTRGALSALLRDPHAPERRPSLSAISGTHREGATLETGQIGYLRALEAAGFCFCHQLPTERAEPDEIWHTSRGDFTSNRYWIVNASPVVAGDDAEMRRALLDLLDAGFEAETETPRLSPDRITAASRGAFGRPQAP